VSREATKKLIENIEEGLFTYEQVALACLRYMSEQDVKDMAEAEEFIEDGDEEE
jgi:hypothetical protein